MSYPYSWKPEHIVPLNPSQITVVKRDGMPATLNTPITINNGTISFSVAEPGSYYIHVNSPALSTSKFFVVNSATNVSNRSVLVVRGDEARPASDLVFWIGGSAQPINMGPNDLWFAPTSISSDTQVPTAPTNITASKITSSELVLSWSASTDNVGIVSYDIFNNGNLIGSSSDTIANLTGLVPGTTYFITIKAKDISGNMSQPSVVTTFTTTAGLEGPTRHSIWGDTEYPFAIVKETGTPVTVSTAFYSYGTDPDMSSWRVIGMKLWIPSNTSLAGPIDCKGWFGNDIDLSTTPTAFGVLDNPISGVWNTVLFNTPIETNAGDFVRIGYRVPNGDLLGLSPAYPQDYITALDGAHIVMAEDVDINYKRSTYMYDNSATLPANNSSLYGIDVIYDEGI